MVMSDLPQFVVFLLQIFSEATETASSKTGLARPAKSKML
jgi:hypothetical protein